MGTRYLLLGVVALMAGTGLLGLDEQAPDLSPDYLGELVPLAFKSQPGLPVTGAAAIGSGGALAGPAGSGIAPSGGGSGGGGATRTAPGMNLGSLRSLQDVAKLFTGDDASRGDTGGSSLSDQVRSNTPSAGQSGLAGFTGNPETMALSADSGSMIPADLTAAFSEGGGLGNVAGQAAGETAALTGEQALAYIGPTLAEAFGGITGLAGLMTLPLTVESLNNLVESIFHPENPLREAKQIRKDFGEAVGPYGGQADTLQQVRGVDSGLPKEQQIEQLTKLLDQANSEVNQGPAVSQFLSTQGGRRSGAVDIPALDVSGYEATSGPLSSSGVVAYTEALDRLGALGADTSQYDWNPQGMLGILLAQGGVDTGSIPEGGNYQSLLTPEEMTALTSGGDRMGTLRGVLSRLNPGFADSPLASVFPQGAPAVPDQEAPAPLRVSPPEATPGQAGGDVFGEEELGL